MVIANNYLHALDNSPICIGNLIRRLFAPVPCRNEIFRAHLESFSKSLRCPYCLFDSQIVLITIGLTSESFNKLSEAFLTFSLKLITLVGLFCRHSLGSIQVCFSPFYYNVL
jgi:hypothetical protein